MTAILTALLLAFGSASHADSGCIITGSAAGNDVARAHSACGTARARFTELFGVQAPRVRIELREQSGYRTSADGPVAVVHWATGPALSAQFGRGSSAERQIAQQWTDVLPHEISHALMIAHFFPEGGAGGHRGYGTPIADWFEEAVAIWAEPAASRATRLAQARRLPVERQDLEAILSGTHPAASNSVFLAVRAGGPPAQNAALWAFYPQSYAVLAFVHKHGGVAAVAQLATRLNSQFAGTELLLGLPGLPEQHDELLRAWQRWLSQ